MRISRAQSSLLVLAGLLLVSTPAVAQTHPEPGESLRGVWSLQFGFGELPFLAGSFKPSISLGYHLNEHFYLGGTVQLRDVLERGDESFNARNLGLGGIESTREETGVRSLIEARYRPHRYSPFLSVGVLSSGSDTEVMRFDARRRTIGSGSYEGAITVEQTRPYAIRPAVGVGYGLTLDSGLAFGVEFAGAFFMGPPEPTVRVESEAALDGRDMASLERTAKESFADNFHNRYHLFNLSAGHVW